MRAKRTHKQPAPAPDTGRPPDATGLTIDWIGTIATGGGGAGMLPVWLVVGLTAVRAAPFVVWRATRRLAGRGGSGRREPADRA